MALSSNLPIYKVTYDLLVLITKVSSNMPRNLKKPIGERVIDECSELVLLIYRANCAREKTPHLVELLERLQVTELLIRLGRDLGVVPNTQYAAAIQLTDKIGKQANGWKKHFERSPAA